MVVKLVLLVASSICVSSAISHTKQKHPDVGLNAKQVIQKYGYPLEVHSIETEDGYILEYHRIPHGKNNAVGGHPVLLMPGLLSNSADFLTLGPGLSLGYILADEGYDVWLANYRGSRWSKKHKTLDVVLNKKEFFDISFQEIGLFDITASIDYILNTTSYEKLFFVGHSQGTTCMFALLATKHEYNDKILLMTGLAPIAYTTHVNYLMFLFTKHFLTELQQFSEAHGIYEFFPYSPLLTELGQILCNDDVGTQPLCEAMFYFFGGYSSNLNKTVMPVILSNTPSGCTLRMMFHLVQIALSGQFQMYDFGEQENLIRYGQAYPPKLDLTKITAPVELYYADKDPVSTVKDVELLAADLPNIVKKQFMKGYNHLDYLWSLNVESVLYSHIVQSIKNYST